MKNFFKENIVYILSLLLVSLLLIFLGQVVLDKFSHTANYENLTTVNDRVRCAKALGWQVDKSSETTKTVYIPQNFTKELTEYNEMQRKCGFDLSPYKGRGAQLYTYRILDYPAQMPVNAFLNIIIYEDKMIGGDCEVDEFDDLYMPVRRNVSDADITR